MPHRFGVNGLIASRTATPAPIATSWSQRASRTPTEAAAFRRCAAILDTRDAEYVVDKIKRRFP
jgi:hypothetical protein